MSLIHTTESEDRALDACDSVRSIVERLDAEIESKNKELDEMQERIKTLESNLAELEARP